MKRPRPRTVAILLAGSLILGAAGASGLALWSFLFGHDRAIASARETVEAVRQFDRLFPAARHSISYYTGTHGEPRWNAKVGLHGRYVLTMQMPIRVGGLGRSRVTPQGPPTFFLREVASITRLPDGRASIRYGGAQVTFGAAEWTKLLESGGDLRVLGLPIETEAPVDGFDERWPSG